MEGMKTAGVRKKGRPRKFESQQALDRRREQLRVAQKAYRARKDSTIGDLQDRVQELEAGIEQLSQSFLSFSDLLLETGLLGKHAHVTSALRKITQQHLSLAETGCASPLEGALNKVVGTTSSTAFDKDERRNDSPTGLPSNDRAPTALSSTPIGWTEPPPLYTQASHNQGQPTPPFTFFTAPLTSEPPIPLSSSSSSARSPAIAPDSPMKEDQLTFTQYLVKMCCRNGYKLLVNTPNDLAKIQEVFGTSMGPTERDNFISCFHAGIHDKTGSVTEFMATALAPLHSKIYNYASGELAAQTEELESTVASEASEWLDASGVQKFLSERGLCNLENSPPFNSSLVSSLHVAAIVQYLATECICFGHGPVFRRQTVEAALRLAGRP